MSRWSVIASRSWGGSWGGPPMRSGLAAPRVEAIPNRRLASAPAAGQQSAREMLMSETRGHARAIGCGVVLMGAVMGHVAYRPLPARADADVRFAWASVSGSGEAL